MTTTSYARNRLHDAIHALTEPTYHNHHPIPARYTQLRDGIANPAISGHHHTPAASMIPAQIDCLKLAIHIDNRVTILTRGTPNRPSSVIDRLQQLTTHKWRPQDIEHVETLTTEINSWVKKIDDLFGPKPVYLKQPCPHCGHNTAHKLNDEGDTIRTPALALTIEHNEHPPMARCQHCHDAWTGPQQLKLLARMLT